MAYVPFLAAEACDFSGIVAIMKLGGKMVHEVLVTLFAHGHSHQSVQQGGRPNPFVYEILENNTYTYTYTYTYNHIHIQYIFLVHWCLTDCAFFGEVCRDHNSTLRTF